MEIKNSDATTMFDFAQGRQETLDVTVPLKDAATEDIQGISRSLSSRSLLTSEGTMSSRGSSPHREGRPGRRIKHSPSQQIEKRGFNSSPRRRRKTSEAEFDGTGWSLMDLSSTKTSDDSSGTGSGGGERRSAKPRRVRNESNLSGGSASSSSRSNSKLLRSSIRKSKSARSLSLKDEFFEPKLVPSKSSNGSASSSSTCPSKTGKSTIRKTNSLRSLLQQDEPVNTVYAPSPLSNRSPKQSQKEIVESRHFSSRSLRDSHQQSKKSNSHNSHHACQGNMSVTKACRSPTTSASHIVTTASMPPEVETRKSIPDLHKTKSSTASPKVSEHHRLENEIMQVIKAIGETASTSSRDEGQRSPRPFRESDESSTKKLNTKPISQSRLDITDCFLDSMPALIDDSTRREKLRGRKGNKQWDILEDTPGGHAPERLAIVPGVEYVGSSIEEADEIVDEDDYGDEDDTSFQDSVSLPRHNRNQIMPRDPAQQGRKSSIVLTRGAEDRFNPSFQSRDMWKSDELNSSDDLSINSCRDIETVSEIDTIVTDDHTLTNHTVETFMLEHDCNHHQHTKSDTPSTMKRTGGRQMDNLHNPFFPGLQVKRTVEEEYEETLDEADRHPSPVPEDQTLNPNHVGIRRRVLSKSSSSPQHTDSNSTGRSSRRKSSRSHSKQRRSGKRPTHNNFVPAAVSSTSRHEVSPILRSPVSSSFTSPQMSLSMNSSSRQVTEQLSAMRQLSNVDRRNSSLQNFVGRVFSSHRMDDDNTLGDSTITTNFSVTQRTFGDNTVSTRSLFQSDSTKGSDLMKIPQRWSGYDSDEEILQDGVQLLQVDSNFDPLQPNTVILQSNDAPASLKNHGAPRPTLRQPSLAGDDSFDEMEEFRIMSQHSEIDSNPFFFEMSESNNAVTSSDSSHVLAIGSNRFGLATGIASGKKRTKRNLFQQVQSGKGAVSSEGNDYNLLE